MTAAQDGGAALLALAERVEKASAPDRELDAEIALATGVVREREGNLFYGHKDYSVLVLERSYDDNGGVNELPAYTSSLDAALTLVPEGHVWLRKDPRTMTVYRVPAGDKEWARHIDATGTAPERALCAASLRALAARGAAP